MPINQLNNGDSGLTARTIINELVASANSGSGGNINTGSFATTGSNSFVGIQIITGSVNITGSLTLNGNTINRPYKVYTVLVSQTGTSHLTPITSGTLTVGTTYQITNYVAGDDFTNVGAPNNNTGTYFVATGGDYSTPVTPTVWTNGSELTSDDGAPTVNVLEDTIGGIFWTYTDVGYYKGQSDSNTFLINKTFNFIAPWTATDAAGLRVFTIYPNNDNTFYLVSADSISQTPSDGFLNSNPLEIRIYN